MLASAFGVEATKSGRRRSSHVETWSALSKGDNRVLDECWTEGADFKPPEQVELDGRSAKKGSDASKAASKARNARMTILRSRLAAARNGEKGADWLSAAAEQSPPKSARRRLIGDADEEWLKYLRPERDWHRRRVRGRVRVVVDAGGAADAQAV